MNVCTSCGDKVPESLGTELCGDCTDERIMELHDMSECIADCPICEEDRDKADNVMEDR